MSHKDEKNVSKVKTLGNSCLSRGPKNTTGRNKNGGVSRFAHAPSDNSASSSMLEQNDIVFPEPFAQQNTFRWQY